MAPQEAVMEAPMFQATLIQAVAVAAMMPDMVEENQMVVEEDLGKICAPCSAERTANGSWQLGVTLIGANSPKLQLSIHDWLIEKYTIPSFTL